MCGATLFIYPAFSFGCAEHPGRSGALGGVIGSLAIAVAIDRHFLSIGRSVLCPQLLSLLLSLLLFSLRERRSVFPIDQPFNADHGNPQSKWLGARFSVLFRYCSGGLEPHGLR